MKSFLKSKPPSRFTKHLLLAFTFLSYSFAQQIPSGESLLHFQTLTSTGIVDVLGASASSVNRIFSIDPDKQRWRVYEPTSSEGFSRYATLSEIEPSMGVYVDLEVGADLQLGDLDSQASYPVRTGWVLSPIFSSETLQSLTSTPGMDRLFAIFGLEGGVWRGRLLQNIGKSSEVYLEILSSSSVSPLDELSSGRAYWMGFLPLGRRVSVASVATDPTGIQSGALNFGTSLNELFYPAPTIPFPGSRHTDSNGSWKGDLYVPVDTNRIYARLDSVERTNSSSGIFVGSLLSAIDLPAGTQSVELAIIPFSRFSSLVALEASFKADLSLRDLSMGILGPLLGTDTGTGATPLSQSNLPILSTVLEDPLYSGVSYPDVETSPGALLHQIGNQLFSAADQNSREFLVEQGNRLSDSLIQDTISLRNRLYTSLQNDAVLPNLFNEISSLTSLSWVVTPNLQDSIQAEWLLLHKIFLGPLEARISSIDQETAVLVPVFGSSFEFSGVPDALKMSMTPFHTTRNAQVALTVRIENASDPENHFAWVKLHGFSLETREDYSIHAEFPEGQNFDFAFKVPENNVISANGSSTNQTLDSDDFRTGQSDTLEIPVEAYLKKADGKFGLSIEEDFGMVISMEVEFEGMEFLLHGSSAHKFSKLRIPALQINQ
jgi:hypothetical protein